MMLFRNSSLIFAALVYLHFVHGQTSHVVTVGQLGSFYDPPTVSAGVNDTVTFVFSGAFHTVTQSLFTTPCVPLPGGFNSGVAGRGTNISTVPPPTWTIRVTNVSEPIWYFCEITTPTSHCASGMVGAINPPSIDVYNQFRMAAEGVTGTAAPSPSLVLTGSGAFATASPSGSSVVLPSSTTASITDSSFVSTSATTDSSTATATSSAAPVSAPIRSATKSHLGAIIGGAVGGIVGIIFIIGALVWWIRQKNIKDRHLSTSSDDSHFFRYNVPVRRPSDAFRAAKAIESTNTTITSNPTTPPSFPRVLPSDTARPLSPVRRGQNSTPPPIIPAPTINLPAATEPNAPHGFERQASFRSQATGGVNPSIRDQASTINMQALANEVAQVLLRSPSGTALNGQPDPNMLGSRAQQPLSMRVENLTEQDHRSGTPQAPPAYRSAMGSPPDPKIRLVREELH